MENAILSVLPEELGKLNAEESTILMRDLLWCEAFRTGLPRQHVAISHLVTSAEGGIDVQIEAAGGTDFRESLLVNGASHYQIKIGDAFKPWQIGMVKEMLFGQLPPSQDHLNPAVRACLDKKGTFVLLALGHELVAQQHIDAKDVLRQQFAMCGYENALVAVLGQVQVLTILDRFPSLRLRLNDRMDTTFQTVELWKKDAEMTPKLALGAAQNTFISDLQTTLQADAIQHVRIIGEPGLGKTRLVLEAINRLPELSAQTLYVRNASEFQKSKLFSELLKPDLDYRIIVIVDECDENDRSWIWGALKGRNPVKLVTITHDPEAAAIDPAMLTISFPPLETPELVSILRTYLGESLGLDKWAVWCEGSARVAHAVGENLQHNPADIHKLPSTVPIWDRFILGYQKIADVEAGYLRVVMRHIALFQKFGLKPPVAEEGRFIAAMAAKVEPAISYTKFKEIVHRFSERRILQGHHTLRIVPKALHLHLWQEWWYHYGEKINFDEMIHGMPQGLYRWFLQLFIDAHGVDSASYAVKKILSPQGLFRDKEFLISEEGSRLLGILAEADAEAALHLLESTLGGWDKEALTAWEGNRQYIVATLKKIAVRNELFARAASLLARLTVGDTSTYANNATATLLGLFDTKSGPVETPLDQKLAVVRTFLASDDPHLRQLGLDTCKSLLTLHGKNTLGGTSGTEYQSSETETPLPRPQVAPHLLDAWRDALHTLVAQTQTGDDALRQAASQCVIHVCRDLLWNNVLPAEAITALESIKGNAQADREKLTTAVIDVLKHHASDMSEDTVASLRRLDTDLTGKTFMERLTRFVLYTIWRDVYNEDGSEHDFGKAMLIRLAGEAVADGPGLEALFPKLLQERGYRLEAFGYEVALAATDERFDAALVAAIAQLGPGCTTPFLIGYLRGVRQLSEPRWEQLSLQLLHAPQSNFGTGYWQQLEGLIFLIREYLRRIIEAWAANRPFNLEWLLDLLSTQPRLSGSPPDTVGVNAMSTVASAIVQSGLSVAVLNQILSLFKFSLVSPGCFQVAALRSNPPPVSLPDVHRILLALAAYKDEESFTVAVKIANSRYCRPESAGQDPEDLLFTLLTAHRLPSARADMAHDHWHELAQRFRTTFPARDLGFLAALLAHASDLSSLHPGSPQSLIADSLCAAYPKDAWRMIAVELARTSDSRHALNAWLGQSGGAGKGAGTMAYFDSADVFAWIDSDRKLRAMQAVDFLPKTLDSGRSGDLTRGFIERYGTLPNVGAHLMTRFQTGVFKGPLSDHLAVKRDDARRWITQTSSTAVQPWLFAYIDYLNGKIDEAKIKEERGEWA